MDIRGVQRLLAAAGYYGGGIDGDAGDKTHAAATKIINMHRSECVSDPSAWSDTRRLMAAGQIILNHAGFEAGAVDGLLGNNTREAFNAWDYQKTNGGKEVVPRVVVNPAAAAPKATKGKYIWPKQSECDSFYGNPENQVAKQLVVIDLPIKFRIDYNLSQTVTRMSIHKKCADSVVDALSDIAKAYSPSQLTTLGLDRFAGSYNKRLMRGSTKSWSMHAYGCAIDFYAGPNGLRVPCPKALFCGEAYKTFFDIWESYGWVSLGRAINRDWMHVQAARL